MCFHLLSPVPGIVDGSFLAKLPLDSGHELVLHLIIFRGSNYLFIL